MLRRLRFIQISFVVASAVLASMVIDATADGGFAQDAVRPSAPVPAKPPRDKYGSPLDTLMNTHLWTDVPPAQDFVTSTRPDRKTLDYTPLTGVDPDRPKVRDKANISALQAELESDKAKNEAKGRVLRPTPKRRIVKAPAARP